MRFVSLVAVISMMQVCSAGAATVLHDIRIIDGNGGPPMEHADIVLSGSHIARIEARRRIEHGDTVISLSGKTALPGLISDHSHLGLVDGTTANAGNVTRENILRQLSLYQSSGVTTVTSLGLNTSVFYELQPLLHAGQLPGADIFGADRGFGVAEGAPPAAMGIGDDQVYRPRTPVEARAQVRETARRHPDLIKLWVDDFHGKVPVKMAQEVYRAVIEEAHAAGLRVAAHVFYLADAKQLVSDGIDVLAHGVRDQPVDAEFVGALKAHHVWYVPTLGLDEAFYLFAEHPELADRPPLKEALQAPLAAQFHDVEWRGKVLADTAKLAQDKQAFSINLRNIKTLYDAGVSIGFGTDSGAMPLRVPGFAEHHEVMLMIEAGLTPLQAISIATRNAAALLHLSDRGLLEPGKLADIVIVDGNPAEDIADLDRIVSVWHRGKQVSH